MKIVDDQFTGIAYRASPNHGEKLDGNTPEAVVIHYTAGPTDESAIRTFLNPQHKVSAHLIIGRKGEITQMVPFDTVAWHAGRSRFAGRSGFNRFSIGIEVVNAGRLTPAGDEYAAWFGRSYAPSEVIKATHRNENVPACWHTYTEKQIDTVFAICEALITAYPTIHWILGHEEISPGRKSDPGPAFPLDQLRNRVLERDRCEDNDLTEHSDPAAEGEHLVEVTATRLNVRSAPSTSAATVAPPLSKGSRLRILSHRNGWYEVENRIHGWILGSHTKKC